MNGGVGEPVKKEVHLAQLHHKVGYVVSGKVGVKFLALAMREPVARHRRAGRGILRQDVFVGGDEETACAACRIEDFVARLGIKASNDEINDMARRAEL